MSPPEKRKALATVAEHTPLPIATGERIHDRLEFREPFELQAAGPSEGAHFDLFAKDWNFRGTKESR